MPIIQALRPQWLIVVLGCIQHHFNNALHVTIRGCQASDVNSQPTCNRGANLIPIELLSFNLARFEYILGKGVQYRFLAKLEAKPLHTAN